MNEVITPSSEAILVSNSDSNEIVLVDPKTSGILETYKDDSVSQENSIVPCSKFGLFLNYQNQKTLLNLWHITDKKVTQRISTSEKLSAFALSNSSLYFFGGSSSGFLYVWETFSGRLLKKVRNHNKPITQILVSQDDGLIITGSVDGLIYVYFLSAILSNNAQFRFDIKNLINSGSSEEIRPRNTFNDHSQRVTDLVMTQNHIGKLFSCSLDKTIICWDLGKGAQIGKWTIDSAINCILLDIAEDNVFAGCANGIIYKIQVNQKALGFEVENLKEEEQVQVPGTENKNTDKDPTLGLKKVINQKREFVEHKGPVLHMTKSVQFGYLITSGKDLKIVFWTFNGEIIKKIENLKTEVTNLVCFIKPKEIENSSFSLGSVQQIIPFQPFVKYEDDKLENQNSRVEKVFVIKKKISKPKKNAHSLYSAIDKIRLSIAKKQNEKKSMSIQTEELEGILQENELLKKTNHQLFNQILLLENGMTK